LSLRVLDTGTAKDVSGVVRITPGGAGSDGDGGDGDGEQRHLSIEEREYLYFVGGDGNARAFERGA
jgi:elongator complex protein 6